MQRQSVRTFADLAVLHVVAQRAARLMHRHKGARRHRNMYRRTLYGVVAQSLAPSGKIRPSRRGRVLAAGLRPRSRARRWRINAAAYTKVDQAESEPAVCRTVNALAVREIAAACARLDCPLVQVSTDYVFGWESGPRQPYGKDDPPGPVNVYGRVKLEGERYAAEHRRHLIVRTCGLYAAPSAQCPHQNFVSTMLRLAADRAQIKVVNDQLCTPTYVPHVARAILFQLSSEANGTYHVSQRGSTTWYDFAAELVRTLSLLVKVRPISSAEYRTLARRPVYSVLDCSKYESLGGPAMVPWRDALRETLATRGVPTRLRVLLPISRA